MRSLNLFPIFVFSLLAAGALAATGGNAFAQPSPGQSVAAAAAKHATDADAEDESKAPARAEEGPAFLAGAESVFDGILLELAPKPLLKRGPYKVLWAQWIGFPIILFVAWLLGSIMSRVTRAIARPIVHRTSTRWDDALIERLSSPITFAWTLIFMFFLLQLLGLRPVPLAFAFKVLRTFWGLALLWALARAIDVGSQVLATSSFSPNMTARRALLPLAARVSKLLVTAFAVVTVISDLGYSVASILAGLGIGGLAVALAAQKTFEHWFGAFAIAVDQPFREGDFVRVDNLQGTIEQIGMRSTRVRTLERTIVSIPNGKLADMQTETFAPRDRMRFSIELRLVYSTTVAQVREILANIDAALKKQPKLRKGSDSAILSQLSHQAMVLEVLAFFDTLDADEFNEIRQELLLEFLEIVESSGTQLALPSQRIELAPSDHEVERTTRASAASAHEATRETTGVVSAPSSLRRP